MDNYKITRKEVAKFFGLNLRELTYVLYGNGKDFYKVFEVPKKNGKTREICAPIDNLKRIQKRIKNKLTEIFLDYLEENNLKNTVSHGFQKGKSIITNAYIHRNKKYLLNIDIENFFPSFNFGRVQGYFYKDKKFNFSKEFATIIAQLVCYKRVLPQGAPTSPVITNLIFNIVDLHIIELAKKYKLDYTRYADDLSFSTNKKTFESEHQNFIQELTELLFKHGFTVNSSKTRFIYSSSRQEVTAITVNKKLNANREFIKRTRAMADQLYKNNSFKIEGRVGTLNQLEGRFSFINTMDRWNNESEYSKLNSNTNKRGKKYLSGLNSREKQYQYFLFYKYFFNPVKPTIVTEGKTDIMHIKAALMKYHNKYPNLIERKEGRFEFKIYFLRKTSRLEYFLGISKTGADTMQNIWHFYNGTDGHKNIFEYLNNKSENKEFQHFNPVILLYDNEQITANKPLKKFMNTLGKKSITINNEDIFLNLKLNLYLQLIPKIYGKDECEIEDLYTDDAFKTVIGDKYFNRKSEIDADLFYGKYRFALHVLENYQNFDFSNFIPLLDSINGIIQNNK